MLPNDDLNFTAVENLQQYLFVYQSNGMLKPGRVPEDRHAGAHSSYGTVSRLLEFFTIFRFHEYQNRGKMQSDV